MPAGAGPSRSASDVAGGGEIEPAIPKNREIRKPAPVRHSLASWAFGSHRCGKSVADGQESCEIVLASRSNRWRGSEESKRCDGSTLIATRGYLSHVWPKVIVTPLMEDLRLRPPAQVEPTGCPWVKRIRCGLP